MELLRSGLAVTERRTTADRVEWMDLADARARKRRTAAEAAACTAA
jgi:hypothetical protein